jgi:uncharacterized protein YjiS (DUF1127 family)
MSTLKAKQFHFVDDMDIAAKTLAAVDRVEGFVTRTSNVFRTWIRRSQDRRMLTQMNDHLLSDIGLTRYDVKLETDKHFWQK